MGEAATAPSLLVQASEAERGLCPELSGDWPPYRVFRWACDIGERQENAGNRHWAMNIPRGLSFPAQTGRSTQRQSY